MSPALLLHAFSAQAVSAQSVAPLDYGELHYLYAGALGDQGCAEHRANGPRKRRFEAGYANRVQKIDGWFERRYSTKVLSGALEMAYGGPGSIDVRDCVVTADGKPAFRDTARFIAKLRWIEQNMKNPPR